VSGTAGCRRFEERVAVVTGASRGIGLGIAERLVAEGARLCLTAREPEELALELAPQVRVNAVAPAIVRTRFAAALLAGGEEQVAAGYPLGRIGTPEDVAAATAFLLSEDASWITGRTLVLDGGSGLNGPL
jgi:3-oxoacyl-[acyl-carrier protein] reductase